MSQTPDQHTAEAIGAAIDREISYLNGERARLLAAPARIADIDAELVILQAEKARIDPRRPQVLPEVAAPAAVDAVTKNRVK